MTRKLVLFAVLATAAVFAVAGTALAQGPSPVVGGDRDEHPLYGILLMIAIAGVAIIGTWFLIRRRPADAVAGAASVPLTPPAPPVAHADGEPAAE